MFEGAAATGVGGVVLELNGGCWLLPEFRQKWSDASLLFTLKSLFIKHFATGANGEVLTLLADMWAPGSVLSAHTFAHNELRGEGGQAACWLGTIASELTSQLLPSASDGDFASLSKEVEPILFKELNRLVAASTKHADAKLAWGAQSFHCSSPLRALAKGSKGATALAEVLKLVERIAGIKPLEASLDWLSKWRPLCCSAHGDLSADHILVDAKSMMWLYCFGASGKQSAHHDGARLCVSLLLESTAVTDEAIYSELCATIDALCSSPPSLLHTEPVDAGKAGPLGRRVLKACQALVGHVVRHVGSSGLAKPPDLHTVGWLVPMLAHTLRVLRSSGQGLRSRLAWYTVQRLCDSILAAVQKPPVELPQKQDGHGSSKLSLAPCQPLRLRAEPGSEPTVAFIDIVRTPFRTCLVLQVILCCRNDSRPVFGALCRKAA